MHCPHALPVILALAFSGPAAGPERLPQQLVLQADRAEVLLLEPQIGDPPRESASIPDRFDIEPYHATSTAILRTVPLSTEQLEKLKPLLKAVIENGDPDGGAKCHFPVHGVRLYRGDEMVFRSSFCWGCQNFFVGPRWVGLRDKQMAPLKTLLSEVVPIPDEMIVRMNMKYPGLFSEKAPKKPSKGASTSPGARP